MLVIHVSDRFRSFDFIHGEMIPKVNVNVHDHENEMKMYKI